ncbi:hypothetical protein SAICODRAFT_67501 [Saitoella complicata NRRL Y-17804]|uniref:rRNA-processing protein n=1 Tax=Saitoella complicata (strain BCRC 22490 / CBS 7301 / JCM 7358 / NBRC 10748 / NRRL Y-17804) TaxID=698492 RepID=A0A0E9NDR0_SAICN|nr:uncharacterized protein SAICODRAFT_67501 [Saitoella complicata NRRL Y-17804]ODQ50685.1 hypothetical protein SAICODRAFT_67501 [Saitoella complicata NRRL Y-17804]GAO47938.1 hypothetical protein G7K_2133-t1 [Saitoella complicata NRRL Y-17804]
MSSTDAQPEVPRVDKDGQAVINPANVKGVRVSGKQWKMQKQPTRKSSHTSWDQRQKDRQTLESIKTRERELKEEQERERQEQAERIRARRAAKEEKERYELLKTKMHAKRVERLRRREKRSKLLKER